MLDVNTVIGLKRLFRSVALVVFFASSTLGTESLFKGDLGSYEVVWRGVSPGSQADTIDPEVHALVAEAFDAAQARNVTAFRALFLEAGHETSHEGVDSLYQAIAALPEGASLILVEEAKLRSTEQRLVAFSIAPLYATLTQPDERDDRLPCIVFGTEVDGEVGLTLRALDTLLAGRLRTAAMKLTESPARGPGEVQRRRTEFQAAAIADMEAKKMPREMIVAMKEVFELANRGGSMRTWEDWLSNYGGEILDPPVRFDSGATPPSDSDGPLGATRRQLHALVTGDAATLLKYADPGGREYLKKVLHVDPSNPRESYLAFRSLTQTTLLLAAQTTVDDVDYHFIFGRAEDPSGGADRVVSWVNCAFREKDGEFYFTRDMDDSPFVKPNEYAGPRIRGISRYSIFSEAWQASSFPKHFYTIE